jgi:hypothetical protein
MASWRWGRGLRDDLGSEAYKDEKEGWPQQRRLHLRRGFNQSQPRERLVAGNAGAPVENEKTEQGEDSTKRIRRSLGIQTFVARSPCNAARDWVGSCVITINRPRERRGASDEFFDLTG